MPLPCAAVPSHNRAVKTPALLQWDDKRIGDGRPGLTTLALRVLMRKDMIYRPDSDQHAEIPYGAAAALRALPGRCACPAALWLSP